jgi:hypothetical protein
VSYPPDAIVVRMGQMKREDVEVSVDVELEDRGIPGISACCIPGLSADDTALASGLPHPVYRFGLVGDLEERGFEVRPDPPPEGHVLVVLPLNPEGTPSDTVWEALNSAFSQPQPSPRRSG